MRPQITRSTLTEQAYRALKAELLDGGRPPGSRLNEKELALQLGVSPTPIREALNKLRAHGLVNYRAWQGTVVAELELDDVVHLSEMRLCLERLAVRQAVPRLQPVDIRHLARLEGAYARAAARAGPGAIDVQRANEDFHAFFAEHSGNRWLRQYMEGLSELLAFARRPLSARSTGAASIPEHAAVVAAIRDGLYAEAEEAMSRHLTRVRDDLVQEIQKHGSARPDGQSRAAQG